MLKEFTKELKAIMPQLISEILNYKKEEQVYGMAFMTTDDFYGMYIAFETIEHLKKTKYSMAEICWSANEWGYSDAELSTNFDKELYHNLVAVVEGIEGIDFTKASDEKWNFAVLLIQAIKEAIAVVPQTLFQQYGYEKDNIVFLTTMSDGDYMDEMLLESAKNLNSSIASKEILDYLGR